MTSTLALGGFNASFDRRCASNQRLDAAEALGLARGPEEPAARQAVCEQGLAARRCLDVREYQVEVVLPEVLEQARRHSRPEILIGTLPHGRVKASTGSGSVVRKSPTSRIACQRASSSPSGAATPGNTHSVSAIAS
jgi:hypothetical protein